MSVIISIVGWMLDRECPVAGMYIKAVDNQKYVRGEIADEWLTMTSDPAEARVWETAADAMAIYREVYKAHPVRPDGKPNRPLTAFSIIIHPLPLTEETVKWR
jgi:hypothetical protein